MSASATVIVAQVAAAIEVTPDAATLGSVGETLQLTATATDANGNTIVDKTFDWTSSEENVVTVDSSGLLTAVAPGEATIAAVACSAP